MYKNEAFIKIPNGGYFMRHLFYVGELYNQYL